jgi:hypothetical protein
MVQGWRYVDGLRDRRPIFDHHQRHNYSSRCAGDGPIARQTREQFPGLDVAMGKQIRALCGNQGIYGLLASLLWTAAKLGAFQVKWHYSQVASTSAGSAQALELIRRSTAALCAWCIEHPVATVAVNFPGVGNGCLPREIVLPIVAQLPEQATIWEYPLLDKEIVL